jgi:hypothetical protein
MRLVSDLGFEAIGGPLPQQTEARGRKAADAKKHGHWRRPMSATLRYFFTLIEIEVRACGKPDETRISSPVRSIAL